MAPSISVDKQVRAKFSKYLRRSGAREIGGIMFGEQISPGRFRLADFTVDDITGSAAHFCRSLETHNAELEKYFANTGYDFSRFNYLGEWHSHPRFPVKPSMQDCHSMLELVRSEDSISFAALVIVRLDWLFVLRLSGIMFSKNARPEKISIERI